MMDAEWSLYPRRQGCLHSLKVKTSVWFCVLYYVYHPDDKDDDAMMMIDFNIFGYVIYTAGEKFTEKKKKK